MKLKRRLQSDTTLLLTPLIDMIFLVVIFFMIIVSLSINPAIRVNLPQAYSSESVLEDQIVVTVSPNGSIYIGGNEVPSDRFVGELRTAIGERGTDRVLLQGDGELAYWRIIEVMDLARISGVTRISLVTAKKSLTE